MKFLTAGESHGPQLTAILEGFPAGVPVLKEDIDRALAQRQVGYGRGRRMAIETDAAQIVGGVRAGRSTGAPIALVIENADWRNWGDIMDPAPGGEPRRRALTEARPGHADLTGGIKYRHRDLRDVLERASARETAARVAVGAVAWALLRAVGVQGVGYLRSLGGIGGEEDFSWDALEAIEASDLRAVSEAHAARLRERIDAAKRDGDTLGGVVEVRVRGLPVGLGSHVHWDRKLDGRLAQAVLSIQAFKGVEIGAGFEAANTPGSRLHDPIALNGEGEGYRRSSNRAGGIEGGMSNGEEIVVRGAMKPIATLMTPLPTVDIATRQPADAARERSDTTAVAAASVVAHAAVGWVLAGALLETFGGDSLEAITERVNAAREYAARY